MGNPECFITENGIRTVVHEDPALLHQSFVVCVDTSQSSANDLNYPHFLEHVLLRDTEQFDGNSYSQVVDETANKSHAGTYPEAITFTLDCVPKAVGKLFPALLATLAKPKLSEVSTARERTIIASEMKERSADPETGLWERAWDNHGFTHTALQEIDGLEEVSPDALRAFHQRTFTPANIFIVTAGPTPTAEIAENISDSPFQPDVVGWQGIDTRDFVAPKQTIVSGNETQQTAHYLQIFNTAPPVKRHRFLII